MIVAATDYEGLGTPGIHPYLVGQSEAQSVLDSARAARELVGRDASNQVAVVGYSQGGQAALFATQIAESYAPELFVAGAVAAAPVTSLDELAPVRPAIPHDSDAVYAIMALDAWSTVYGNIALPSVLTPLVARQTAAVTTECSNSLAPRFDGKESRQLFRGGWNSQPGVLSDAQRNRPGQAPTSTPLLVVEGSEDQVTPYRTVTAFVDDDLCRGQDDAVQYVQYRGVGHGDVLTFASSEIVRWVSARLAGAALTTTCPSR
jgi:pimeloyl-ACP methyl ester carboxylesterase